MSGMRGQNQPGRVVVRLIAGLDRANSPLVGQQPIAIQNRSGIRLGRSSGPAQNFNQVFSTCGGDDQLEQEPVQLSFGQGIRPFLLDRVLGGHHHKRRGQLVGHPTHRDRPFLHGLQHRRLGLGRRSVDFIGQQQLRKDRTAAEDQRSPLLSLLHHRGAGDVRGHQVRGELDPAEVQAQCGPQSSNQEGFAQPRNPFQQHMPACKQGGEDTFHHIILPHQDRTHCNPDRFPIFGKG